MPPHVHHQGFLLGKAATTVAALPGFDPTVGLDMPLQVSSRGEGGIALEACIRLLSRVPPLVHCKDKAQRKWTIPQYVTVHEPSEGNSTSLKRSGQSKLLCLDELRSGGYCHNGAVKL